MALSSQPDPVSYGGEVWTDARGYAVVTLPPGAVPPLPPFDYSLRDVDGGPVPRVAVELHDGRFTIETDEPHVKVAWRVSGRRRQQQPKEEKQ